jgi:GMP synthase-like glutamine amidotransferase
VTDQPVAMQTLCVVQHIEAEFLGFLEDHLESRNIRFRYFRPFTKGGKLPEADVSEFDGLILLGAGPLGIVSGPLIPSLGAELRLAERFLAQRKPVVGMGAGAILATVAAGGGADEAPLRFEVGRARRCFSEALSGSLPERFPYAAYLRDTVVLPRDASVLAEDEHGAPLIFSIGDSALGFINHPGMKSAMAEDIIMEFDETPPDTPLALQKLRDAQHELVQVLSELMVGLVHQCGWMDHRSASAAG